MNFLEAVQSVCLRFGLPGPNAAVASQDPFVQQIVELLHEEGDELSIRHPWQVMTGRITITSDGTGNEGDITVIAPGFFKFINDTFWNQTRQRKLQGPLDGPKWAALTTQTSAGTYSAFRVFGNTLRTYPYASVGDLLTFEYQAKWWLQSAGTTVEFARTDEDVFLLDAKCICLGAIWRVKKAKGMDYAEDFKKYEYRVSTLTGSDGAAPTLHLGRRRLTQGPNIPDGNWTL